MKGPNYNSSIFLDTTFCIEWKVACIDIVRSTLEEMRNVLKGEQALNHMGYCYSVSLGFE
jgi:hypothetical protein